MEWLFSNFEMKDMGEASYSWELKSIRIVLENFQLYHKSLILEEFLKKFKWINVNLLILPSIKDRLLALKCVQRLQRNEMKWHEFHTPMLLEAHARYDVYKARYLL